MERSSAGSCSVVTSFPNSLQAAMTSLLGAKVRGSVGGASDIPWVGASGYLRRGRGLRANANPECRHRVLASRVTRCRIRRYRVTVRGVTCVTRRAAPRLQLNAPAPLFFLVPAIL